MQIQLQHNELARQRELQATEIRALAQLHAAHAAGSQNTQDIGQPQMQQVQYCAPAEGIPPQVTYYYSDSEDNQSDNQTKQRLQNMKRTPKHDNSTSIQARTQEATDLSELDFKV